MLVEEWANLCPHPSGTDILFYPEKLSPRPSGEIGSDGMSPDDMVDFALAWEPQTLAMKVVERSGGASVGYYLYNLDAPGIPKTQVATSLDTLYEVGTVVVVALKGVRLADGTVVETCFDLGPLSCGRILGITAVPVGTRVPASTAENSAEPRGEREPPMTRVLKS